MRRFLLRLSIRIIVCLIVLSGVIWLGLSVVRADVQAGWLSTATPAIKKVTDLPANQPPALSNRDCTQLNYNIPDPVTGILDKSGSDCFVQTTGGEMALYGSPVLYSNTSIAMRITGYNNDRYTLVPIPNQGLTLSLTSAPVIGGYANFYTDYSRHLTTVYGTSGFPVSYFVNKGPDFTLLDKNGAMIAINPNTISYSSDGSWMLVDAYSRGFLRINMATFDITSFAQTFTNGPNDYATHYGLTSISNDGRYAIIASGEYRYAKVYDLSTCTGTVPNDYSQQQNCQYRDYWPTLASNLSNLSAVYSARFVNDDNITLTATYNRSPANSSTYSAATFRLTAPGKSPHGLDYLAMGDSYISGQGEFVYKDGTDTNTNTCHLSPLSYPYTIGADLFNQYQSVACSGATTNDIINPSTDYSGQVRDGIRRKNRDAGSILANFNPGYITQLEFVRAYQPSVVTLSIGGNDIHFAGMLTSCVNPLHIPTPSGETCFNTYDKRAQVLRNIDGVYSKLQDTYRQIIQADPGVQLYVIGYPQIAGNGSCGDNVHLNASEIQFSQQLVTYLDNTIQKAADSTGARYVDTQHAMDGNKLCEASPNRVAINGVTAGNDNSILGVKVIGNESFHPNVLGHQLLAQYILSHTNNFTLAMPSANSALLPANFNGDSVAQAMLATLTPSGKPLADIETSGNDMIADSAVRGSSTPLTLDGTENSLKPSSTYHVLGDSSSIDLGTINSDANGDINTQITLPANLTPGYHTIDVTGQNIAGQSIDIYELIYVVASADDYDGDGIPNSANSCLVIQPSGNDADSDGIDDACDPLIGPAPTYHYPVSVTLTNNSIQIINPH